MNSELSLVSQKYDVEKKGYLTKEEQALRNLDREGKGHLSAEDLAPLMEEYRKLHEDNVKSRHLLIFLFISVVLLGISTIVASVLAVNASKDTAITAEGVLTTKDTNKPIITTSQGISVTTKEIIHPDTGEIIQCLPISSIADLYISFSRGTNILLHLDNTLSINDDSYEEDKHSLSILKISGTKATYSNTNIDIGNVAFDVSPENPCKAVLHNEKVTQHGDVRKLFQRHLNESESGNTTSDRYDWSLTNLPDCSTSFCGVLNILGGF